MWTVTLTYPDQTMEELIRWEETLSHWEAMASRVPGKGATLVMHAKGTKVATVVATVMQDAEAVTLMIPTGVDVDSRQRLRLA